MGRILLDPNAQAYADLNDLDSAAATKLSGIDAGAEVNPADTDALPEGSTNKYDTGDPIPKLTDDEVIAAINASANPITREDALSQADLKIVKSEPQSGERAVTSISVDADDKLAADHSDTPEP